MDMLNANVTCFVALEQLAEDMPGKLYSIDELSHESEDRRVVMDSPPSSLIKIGVARDWPDARALWLVRVNKLWLNNAKQFDFAYMFLCMFLPCD